MAKPERMPASVIEFWYEFASPYSYIAAMRIEALAAGAGLRIGWRPFLLGPIFKRRPHNPSPFQEPDPAERRYRQRDVERLCARFGIPLRWPSIYPPNGLLAARVALLGSDAGWCPAFTRAAYRAAFAENRDIAGRAVIAEVLEGIGQTSESVLEAALAPANKQRLAAQVEAAIASGIFGAPSLIVGAELFWGSDRLEQAVEWALRAPAPSAPPPTRSAP